MAIIKFHGGLIKNKLFRNNSVVILFQFSSSIFRNLRILYISKAFWLDFALISVIFGLFQITVKFKLKDLIWRVKWSFNLQKWHHLVEGNSGLSNQCKFISLCSNRKKTQGGSIHPTPFYLGGVAWASLNIRGLIEDNLNPGLFLFSLEEIWRAKLKWLGWFYTDMFSVNYM